MLISLAETWGPQRALVAKRRVSATVKVGKWSSDSAKGELSVNVCPTSTKQQNVRTDRKREYPGAGVSSHLAADDHRE